MYYATEMLSHKHLDAVHLVKYEGSVIPANNGFVVIADADNTAASLRFTYTARPASLPEGNILKGHSRWDGQ